MLSFLSFEIRNVHVKAYLNYHRCQSRSANKTNKFLFESVYLPFFNMARQQEHYSSASNSVIFHQPIGVILLALSSDSYHFILSLGWLPYPIHFRTLTLLRSFYLFRRIAYLNYIIQSRKYLLRVDSLFFTGTSVNA